MFLIEHRAFVFGEKMIEKQNKYPWGYAKVLTEGENYKVKRISLNPSSRQSYQSHERRAEAWVIVSGEGKITIDDVESSIGPAAVIMISMNVKHRIENISHENPLVFVETQFGTYIGEDDIIRYEDDYGRHLDNWADVDADLL